MFENLSQKTIEKAIVYDIETFCNGFFVYAYSLKADRWKIWEISDRKGEKQNRETASDILGKFKGRYWVGYNNRFFDDNLLNCLTRTNDYKELYNISQSLIAGEKIKFRTRQIQERSYDLMKILSSGFNAPSLKHISASLGMSLQDLPLNPEKPLKGEDYNKIIKYNYNDVLVTVKLLDLLSEQINMREVLSSEYKMPLYAASDSNIAKKILTNLYSDNDENPWDSATFTSPDKIKTSEIIYDWVYFKTEKMQNFLKELKESNIVKTKSSKSKDDFQLEMKNNQIDIGDNTYRIGLGGLHSIDESLDIKPTSNSLLLDLDVASQYPTSILLNGVAPSNVDSEKFLSKYKELVDKRLYHKKYKKSSNLSKAIDSGLKITINSVFGFLNSKYFWTFDPKAHFTVTLNNQLALLMLIDEFENHNIKILSANTDGILLYSSVENRETIEKCKHWWQKVTGFTLEETRYKHLVKRDINNYFAIDDSNNIKSKGIFSTEIGLNKGFIFPIINKALVAYFKDGKIPRDFLNEHLQQDKMNLLDFCFCQKTSKKFQNENQSVFLNIYHKGKTGKELKHPNIEVQILDRENQQSINRLLVVHGECIYDNGDKQIYKGKRVVKWKYLDLNSKFKNIKKLDDYGFTRIPYNYTRPKQYSEYIKNVFTATVNDISNDDYIRNLANMVNFDFYIDKINQEIKKIESLDTQNNHQNHQNHQNHGEQLTLL